MINYRFQILTFVHDETGTKKTESWKLPAKNKKEAIAKAKKNTLNWLSKNGIGSTHFWVTLDGKAIAGEWVDLIEEEDLIRGYIFEEEGEIKPLILELPKEIE